MTVKLCFEAVCTPTVPAHLPATAPVLPRSPCRSDHLSWPGNRPQAPVGEVNEWSAAHHLRDPELAALLLLTDSHGRDTCLLLMSIKVKLTFTAKPSRTKTGKSLGTPFCRWMR